METCLLQPQHALTGLYRISCVNIDITLYFIFQDQVMTHILDSRGIDRSAKLKQDYVNNRHFQ